jgi:hypothetical protein
MNLVKFFRGVKANYQPETTHLDGLYFATDTAELLMNGTAYGDTIAQNGIVFTEVASGANKGKVLATITMTSGTVFENVDTQCYGRDEIDTLLAEINATATQNAIDNADGSINVTEDAQGNGTDINVNIKSTEKVIKKDGGNGIYTNFKLEKLATATNNNTAASYELVAYDAAESAASRTVLGSRIDIAKDQFLASANVVDANGTAISASGAGVAKYLRLVFNIADGSQSTTDIDISSFIQEAEAGDGLAVTNGVMNVVKDANSENFLKVNANSISIEGVQNAIDAKATNLAISAEGETGYINAAVDANNNKKINVSAEHLDTTLSNNNLTIAYGDTGFADTDAMADTKTYIDAHDTKINTRVTSLSGQSGETYVARTVAQGESSYISDATSIQHALNKLDDVAVAHTALLTWQSA